MSTENLLESEDLIDSTGREDRATTISKKFRVQLDFEPVDMAMINRLVEELGLGTRAELFRSSLRALRWMVEKKKQGCVVLAVTPDERYIQPEFDFLDGLDARAEATRPAALPAKAKAEAETRKAPAHA
jgi:hypothetical protein